MNDFEQEISQLIERIRQDAYNQATASFLGKGEITEEDREWAHKKIAELNSEMATPKSAYTSLRQVLIAHRYGYNSRECACRLGTSSYEAWLDHILPLLKAAVNP